ncbi:MAG: SGNH/GDSL hydrolase family protein [Nocardioidaceae bacterium]|nr:SGNH/GDSL hydrolase family protein [Nocardioidaceae bacterium]
MPRPSLSPVVGLALAVLLGLTACSGSGPADDAAVPSSRTADASPAPTTSATPGGAYDQYVALGDSYTSGPFVPLVRLDPVGCARSTSNYPAYVAELLRVGSYTDVSCQGAETADMTATQDTGFGTNVPQLDAVTADTDLVTLGIGGNDFGIFAQLTQTCSRLAQQDPAGAPCRASFERGGTDTLLGRTEEVGDRVAAVLAEVARRAPDAEVVVVGYPRILPASGTCPTVPFAAGDYAWASDVERSLNGSLRRAAEGSGATYVDTFGPSREHSACAGDDAWINGSELDAERALSFHPFREGMQATASEVVEALTGRVERATTPYDSGAPTMSTADQKQLAARLAGAAPAS